MRREDGEAGVESDQVEHVGSSIHHTHFFPESTLILLQFKNGESWMLGLNELATCVAAAISAVAALAVAMTTWEVRTEHLPY